MPDFLKGNYELTDTEKIAADGEEEEKSITRTFEDSALAKLGGSVCFVQKGNTLLWAGDDIEEAG